MLFNAKGEHKFLYNYFKPHIWSYTKEGIEVSPTSQQQSGTFKLRSNIRKPQHVFIWALSTAKLDGMEQNMFVLNAFAVGIGNRQFTSAQLEPSNGTFHSQKRMEPNKEVVTIYCTLMRYSRQLDN